MREAQGIPNSTSFLFSLLPLQRYGNSLVTLPVAKALKSCLVPAPGGKFGKKSMKSGKKNRPGPQGHRPVGQSQHKVTTGLAEAGQMPPVSAKMGTQEDLSGTGLMLMCS